MDSKDRFQGMTSEYDLFLEVYRQKGSDYKKLERSVFNSVNQKFIGRPDYKFIITHTPLLDIGTGDGLTLEPFVEAGYLNLTGYDLNPEMLDSARKRLGDRVELIQGDACNLSQFNTSQFPIIISGMCVHNIPKNLRNKFWSELTRLDPVIFSIIDKIQGDDKDNYHRDYIAETETMSRVFRERGLDSQIPKWLEHYIYDERPDVKLYLSEVLDRLSSRYTIKITNEEGMWKTLIALRK